MKLGWCGENVSSFTFQWRHNDCGDMSNHQPHECLLNRLFRLRSKKTSTLRVTGLGEGNYRWRSCGEFLHDRSDVTHHSCAKFKCDISDVSKQIPIDSCSLYTYFVSNSLQAMSFTKQQITPLFDTFEIFTTYPMKYADVSCIQALLHILKYVKLHRVRWYAHRLLWNFLLCIG